VFSVRCLQNTLKNTKETSKIKERQVTYDMALLQDEDGRDQ